MNTTDLKKEVLARITATDDMAFLQMIKTLFDNKEGEPVIMLYLQPSKQDFI